MSKTAISLTNGNLLNGQNGEDHLFVVTEEPTHQAGATCIAVHVDKPAAVIDRHREKHPSQPYTINDVRKGHDNLWLLSGGTIIHDERGRIAIGLRDGNAADPFTFTNIGAGRCDRKLKDHCHEEFESEFILCFQEGRQPKDWRQVEFGSATPKLAEVRRKTPSIQKWKGFVVAPEFSQPSSPPAVDPDYPGASEVSVIWYEGDRVLAKEELNGYVFMDRDNRTLEFRLPLTVDLSGYENTEIFYAEGTGYALWMYPAQIQEVVTFKKATDVGVPGVTPLLADIVSGLNRSHRRNA